MVLGVFRGACHKAIATFQREGQSCSKILTRHPESKDKNRRFTLEEKCAIHLDTTQIKSSVTMHV
jgi:hypothetical protein